MQEQRKLDRREKDRRKFERRKNDLDRRLGKERRTRTNSYEPRFYGAIETNGKVGSTSRDGVD